VAATAFQTLQLTVTSVSDKSHPVAGKPRDATVNFDPYVSNTINKGPWQMDVKLSYVTYLIYKLIDYILSYFLQTYLLHTYSRHSVPSDERPFKNM